MRINLDIYAKRSWPEIKRYWRHIRGPCSRCNLPIDYDGKYWEYIYENNSIKKVVNIWALDVGHIVEKDLDPRTDINRWENGRTWCPAETQPEHVKCNRRYGARYGNRKRGMVRQFNKLRTSREW